MNVFNYDKKINILIAILSVTGICCLNLIWMEYPRIEVVLKGMQGDGWLFAFFFFLILCFTIYLRRIDLKEHHGKVNMLIFFFALLILSIAVHKIFKFNREVSEGITDNPIIGYAASGAKLGIGLYANAWIALVIMILALFSTFFSKIKNLILFSVLTIVLTISSYLAYQYFKPKLTESEVVENLAVDFDKMSQTLINKRPDLFVNYIHPILYQSLGGKEKLVNIMTEMYANINIQEAEIVKIMETEKKGDNVQSLLMQKFTIFQDGEARSVTNKTLAFSYDGGQSWTFAGTENRSFEEMKEIIPEIFEELEY